MQDLLPALSRDKESKDMSSIKELVKTVLLPDWISIKTGTDFISREYHPGEIYGNNIQVEVKVGKKKTDVFLTSFHESVEWVMLRWNEKLLDGGRILGDVWERGYGNLEWRSICANRPMPWYFAAECMGGFACVGVMTNPSALCFWEADTDGITLYMDVRCGGMGVMLGERKLLMASVVERIYKDCTAFEGTGAFCRVMCPEPLLPDHPVYGGNNWYYAYGETSHEEMLRDTRFILELTKGCKEKPYMVLDDGWQAAHQADGYNGGPWDKGNSGFSDMGRLAEQMAEEGVRPGIWIRPLYDEISEVPGEWRIKHNNCLDPSHPDVRRHISSVIKRICEWGYELIKYDFVTYDLFGKWGYEMNPSVTENGWRFYERSMTSAEVVKSLYRTIYEAAKPYGTILLGCNAIGHLGTGYMHINRIGDDISGKEWERTRKMGINALAFRLCQHNTFYHVDADCVGITEKIPWDMNRQWADVIARSGTPLFISAAPESLSGVQQRELADILKIASTQKHHAHPLDWMSNTCPKEWLDEKNIIVYKWYTPGGLTFVQGDGRDVEQLPGI